MGEDYLKMFLEEQTKDIKEKLQQEIDTKKEEVFGDLDGKLKQVDDMLKKLTEVTKMPLVVLEDKAGLPTGELCHRKLQTLINLVVSSKREKVNMLLVGGAGGGKSYMVRQLAKLMKLPFYSFGVNAQTTSSQLKGFVDATGNYKPTALRKAYEFGGVFCLDEIDAGNANVLCIMNNIISENEMEFPDGTVKKNKDFWIVATANTYGHGATMQYVGRNRLDDATLDRFTFVDIEYDIELERAITHCDDWMDIIGKIRKNIDKYDLKVIVSPRASMKGADLYDAKIPLKDIIEMVILKGASDDIRSKLLDGIDL